MWCLFIMKPLLSTMKIVVWLKTRIFQIANVQSINNAAAIASLVFFKLKRTEEHGNILTTIELTNMEMEHLNWHSNGTDNECVHANAHAIDADLEA